MKVRQGLAYKQTRTCVLIAFVLGVLTSFFQIFLDYLETKGQQGNALMQTMLIIEEPFSEAVLENDIKLIEDLIVGLFRYEPIYMVEVKDKNEKVLSSKTRGLVQNNTRWMSDLIFGESEEIEIELEGVDESAYTGWLLEEVNDASQKHKKFGSITVAIDTYYGEISFLRRSGAILIFGMLRNSILVLILLWFFHRYLVRPLITLEENLQRIDPENPENHRLAVPLSHEMDELGDLVNATNRLLQTIDDKVDNLEVMIDHRTKELRTKAEQLEKSNFKAEAANRAKSEFLANMSHEIRTPMNAILGFAEIMTAKVRDSQFTRYLDAIQSSGQSLLSLINDILDLSKVEAGKMDLEYAAVSPQNLFQEMGLIFEQKIKDKGLDFVISLPPDLPEALLLDETRLRQILINLIGNAIKFTETGYIKLRVHSCPLSQNQQGLLDFTFSVEDTGKGIPPEQCESIFAAFSQAKSQKFTEFGGTGLGLAITKNLIEMMNGEIHVQSVVGQGSSFNIVLQDVEVTASSDLLSEQEQQLDFETIHFEFANILIADDIEFNREVIAGFLEDQNFNLWHAEHGLEVMDIIEQEKPDLILLDMKMPKMDGYETATLLRQNPELEDVPIIAVTASAMLEDEVIINHLCNLYLKKPLNRSVLFSALMEYLPYQIKELSGEEGTEGEELSADTVSRLPGLIDALEEEFKPLWKALEGKLPMKEVKKFGEEMNTLGKKYEVPTLREFGDELVSDIEQFDVAAMKSTFQNFPGLIESLKTYQLKI